MFTEYSIRQMTEEVAKHVNDQPQTVMVSRSPHCRCVTSFIWDTFNCLLNNQHHTFTSYTYPWERHHKGIRSFFLSLCHFQ